MFKVVVGIALQVDLVMIAQERRRDINSFMSVEGFRIEIGHRRQLLNLLVQWIFRLSPSFAVLILEHSCLQIPKRLGLYHKLLQVWNDCLPSFLFLVNLNGSNQRYCWLPGRCIFWIHWDVSEDKSWLSFDKLNRRFNRITFRWSRSSNFKFLGNWAILHDLVDDVRTHDHVWFPANRLLWWTLRVCISLQSLLLKLLADVFRCVWQERLHGLLLVPCPLLNHWRIDKFALSCYDLILVDLAKSIEYHISKSILARSMFEHWLLFLVEVRTFADVLNLVWRQCLFLLWQVHRFHLHRHFALPLLSELSVLAVGVILWLGLKCLHLLLLFYHKSVERLLTIDAWIPS